ncbi:ATP-binding protein, partial [Clavibacter michiganensis]|uniref:ATP-binding protein n=1 Tax=Clavibacter michiganensis TaxID=28447 RepID=UPI00292DE037
FETKESCAVEVEDTGGGVDDKILPKIFDPFFTTKEKGVGLGLSVAHKIAAQHKALLTASSKGGRTVFSLQFPKLLV